MTRSALIALFIYAMVFFLAESRNAQAATILNRAFGRVDHVASSLVGRWEGEVTRDGKRWNVALNATEIGNEIKASIDFVDLDVVDIPFPVTRIGDRFRLERPQPSGNPIVFDGEVVGNTFVGKWNGFGVDGSFVMKRGEARAKAYREEEVSFSNGNVSLSGTLLIPDGREKRPAVVLVHGSSPNERTTYRSWARHFAENGVAALIYDKRGSGKSTGNTRAASMENLADDALAGIRMLRLRRDIHAGKVGIAGHSQGGWIAPLAAARSGDVAFVIVSAAAAVTPAEQSIYHRAGVMRDAGMTDVEIGEATRLREQLYLLNRKIMANDPDVRQ
jgi:alpha/beta superfamily hydrolase